MPKLNARGDVIMGIAGIQGSINGRPYPFRTFGRGAWLDDDRIVVALASPPADAGASSGAVYAWRPFIDPDGLALELLDRRPFNFLAAGGGEWVALLAIDPPLQFGSLGDQPGAGAADVARDGSIVYKTGYFADWGLTFVDPAGARTVQADAFPVDYQALPGGRAIWRGGAHGRAPIRPALPDAAFAKLATLAGEDWIVYWSEARKVLVVQPDGAADGYVFPIANAFDYDLIALADRLVLASATTQGEGPGDLTKIEIARAGVRYLVGAGPIPTWGPITVAPPLVFPTFRFSHPVNVHPFKAEGSGRPDLFTLGTYTEAPVLPSPLPAGRLLLAHDGTADWTIPAGDLRMFDLVLWELYRLKGETLAESADRWERQTRANLLQWPRDCGVIPMFYNQFNPATGAWLWTDAEVLEGLELLDQIVNLDPRIIEIAPFEWDRANGIKPNPNLIVAFLALVAAADRAGAATLTPVSGPPAPPPDPPDPPRPFRTHTKGSAMAAIDGKIVRLRGAGGRVIAPDAPNTGPWGSLNQGWRGARPVNEGDAAARMRARKLPNGRYTFTSELTNGLAGEDATRYSGALDKQTYFKPDGNTDAGDYEQWRVYDGNENGAIEAQVEHVTDDQHPDGAGRKSFAFPLAVEIVS